MVKKGKKYIYIFLSILILITGCSKKETTGKIELSLAFPLDIRNRTLGMELIKIFQESYPSIKIKPVFIEGHYSQKLLTMIAGGDFPDIFVVDNFMLGDFAERGVLLNLGPYMEKDQEFQSFKDDIFQTCLKNIQYNGNIYSVPIWTNSLGLFYNKDIFDEEKIEYPDENWDWDKLVSVGKKLTKDIDGDGKIDRYALWTSTALTAFGGLYPYIRQNGCNLFNEDMSECTIDSPECMEAIMWCFDLVNKHKIAPSPFIGDERLMGSDESFLSQKVAMTISGRWSILLFSEAKFRWSCAPLPQGKVKFKPVGTMQMGAYSRTKHAEDCWEFLKFVMEKEAQEKVSEIKSDMPVRISVANSSKFLDWQSRREENRILLEELEGGESFPYILGVREWFDSANIKLNLVLLGQKDLKSALKEIKEEYKKYRKK